MNSICKKTTQGAICVLTFLCSSCYFNSAGHIFRNTAYDAEVDTANMGKHIYYDGENYYAEFTRFRVGKKVVTQYNAFKKPNDKTMDRTPQGLDLYRIPSGFASYLISGKGSSALNEFDLVIDNPKNIIERSKKILITHTPDQTKLLYKYKSPNAYWYYIAGTFVWLCVDLPITCIENSLMIAFMPIAAISKGMGDAANANMNNQAMLMQPNMQNTTPNYAAMMNNGGMQMGGQMPMLDPYTTLTPNPETGKLSSPALESYNKRMNNYLDYERRKVDNFNPRY